MSRQTATVLQLYTEWYTGLDGKPSVVAMDRQFGTKRRNSDKERTFFSVRKTIIDHIEERRQGGENLDAIIRHLWLPGTRAFRLSLMSSVTGETRRPVRTRRRLGTTARGRHMDAVRDLTQGAHAIQMP
jgi:Transcriptional activator of glycolytic enzymes